MFGEWLAPGHISCATVPDRKELTMHVPDDVDPICELYETLAEAQLTKPRRPAGYPPILLFEVKAPDGETVYCWAESCFQAVYAVAQPQGWRAMPME